MIYVIIIIIVAPVQLISHANKSALLFRFAVFWR